MKKIVIFLMIVFSICLVGCSKNYDYEHCISEEEMTEDLKSKLKTMCYKSIMKEDKTKELSNDDIYIKYYIGRYGKIKNAYVVIFSDLKYKYTEYEELGFYQPSCYDKEGEQHSYIYVSLPEHISVIHKNNFYSISEACKKGILSYDEFIDIHNRFITIQEVIDIYTEKDATDFMNLDMGDVH